MSYNFEELSGRRGLTKLELYILKFEKLDTVPDTRYTRYQHGWYVKFPVCYHHTSDHT